MDTARDEGKAEGIEIGIQKTAQALLKEEISEEIILKVTGLTAEQLEELK